MRPSRGVRMRAKKKRSNCILICKKEHEYICYVAESYRHFITKTLKIQYLIRIPKKVLFI